MSLSRGRFTEAELDSLSLWDTPDFFNPDGSVNPDRLEEVAHAPILTVEEIEAMQKQAYEEAFAQGGNEGRTQGYQEGFPQGLEEGRQQGYQEGYRQGMEETRQLQRQQAAEFVSLMESLNEPFKNLDGEVEKQLVDLAIAIASHLVRRELKLDPGEVIAVVRAAVNVLPVAAQKITLHLHPLDAGLVKTSLALTDAITSWSIIEDPLMTQGGCKVATDVSYVDATVEKRLAQVIAMVLGGGREDDNTDTAVTTSRRTRQAKDEG